uniref:CSD domain-containing protein n=1 Tax=Caenorhabditis japonica TaxID=281687 RepID=A0A8R1HKY4_CAEJA
MSDTANAAVEIAEEALEKLESLTVDDVTPPANSEEKLRKKRLPTVERIRIWEEEQKSKTILATGVKGKVKWYSVLRRYGFISRDDGEKDVFVHQTAISKSATEKFYLRTLADEEEVVFDLVDGKNGPEASNVTGPDGENVIGSKYRHKLLSRFRKNRKPIQSDEESALKADADQSSPTAEETKPKKQRKNKNRKSRGPRKEKGAGDAADSSAVTENTEASDSSATGSPDGKVSKIITDEASLSKRCDSALGDSAGLGAQPIDAQI